MTIHKAEPQDSELGVSACKHCAALVKHLPAGQGWVHTETGTVVGSGGVRGNYNVETILAGRDVELKYVSVITGSSQETIESYLWFGARIVVIMPGEREHERRNGFVIKVHETHGGRARAQADRLLTGLHGARVHDTFGEAVEHLSELVA
jgi:hypothetical protein